MGVTAPVVSELNDTATGGLLEMLTRKQYELLRFINERLRRPA